MIESRQRFTRHGSIHTPLTILAAMLLLGSGCEMTIPGGNGNNDDSSSMDMSTNGADSDVMPDDSDVGDDGVNASAKIELVLTALATDADFLDTLGITLDQSLAVESRNSTQATPADEAASRSRRVRVAADPQSLQNTIAVSPSLVGGIENRQVMIGVKFVEVTPVPIAFPIDASDNEAIKAFMAPPPNGLNFLSQDDIVELPELNDLNGGVILDSTTTPELDSIQATLLNNTDINAILAAANENEQNIVLNAPKVTVLNGQYTSFIHRNEFADSTDLEPEFKIGKDTVDEEVPFVQSGFVLDVIPQVNSDGSVTLTIVPGTRGIVFAQAQTVQINGVEVFIELPVFQRSTVETSVSVPDGGTILLGGIKRLAEGDVEHGLPVLSKIPYVSRLFTNTAAIQDSQSLMLMVTPRIIIQEEDE